MITILTHVIHLASLILRNHLRDFVEMSLFDRQNDMITRV